jgi:cytoskeletal protein RodZ
MTDRFKKLFLTIAALAGLAAGGAVVANAAQGGGTPTPTSTAPQSQTADTPESGDKPDGNEASDQADGNEASDPADGNDASDPADGNDASDKADGNDASDQVTGADAQKAKDAALAATGGGKVNEVSAEQHDAADNGKADTPEPGDTPDPAYESQIAYDVEVTKADGTVVDVHLDKAFKVLGTEKADAEHGHQD